MRKRDAVSADTVRVTSVLCARGCVPQSHTHHTGKERKLAIRVLQPWSVKGQRMPGWLARRVGAVKFYLISAATGSLHKAVVPENSSAYLVEEIQLSPAPEPVRNLQLAPTQVRRDQFLVFLWGGPGEPGPG